jgi:hypothetical protein
MVIRMRKTKIILAAVTLAAVAIVAVGYASAQIAATSNPTTGAATPYNGFWGWMGRCFGINGAPYYGTQAPTSASQPLNITVIDPNTNTTTSFQMYPGYGAPYYSSQPQNATITSPITDGQNTYQGYLGNGFAGRGCMGRFW